VWQISVPQCKGFWACRIDLDKVCFRNHICERITPEGLVDYCPIYLRAKFTERKCKASFGTNPCILSRRQSLLGGVVN